MEAGQTLSHYRLIEKIGAGGMGVVWKAKDTILDRLVAIKVLPPSLMLDEERRRMFLDEARLAASLNHAHIVQVHELGREGGLDFIVMELVEGESLSRVLQGRPVSVEKVARWGVQVAEALGRAHRKNLLHRDVKPGNILLTSEDDVKLVDFGLAKLLPEAASTVSAIMAAEAEAVDASHASIAGTLPYMSPEQLRGEKLDARSDIYSLGVVLYEMTTGQCPFRGAPSKIAAAIRVGRELPVHDVVPKVPLELDRIIEKAMATRRTERFQTMDDLAVDLRHLMKELESGSSPSYEDLRVGRPGKSAMWRRAVLIGGLLLLTAAAGVFAWNRRARDQRSTKAAVASTNATNWIMVGEFEGVGERDGLARAAREIVVASLEQSDVVTPIPRADIKRGLDLAMKPDTTRVVGEVARELAARAGARTFLEGNVDRVLKGYSVIVRIVDTKSGETLLSETALVENEEAFMRDLDGLSKRLRVRLGEKEELLRSTRLIYPGKTPSFEAFQWWVRCIDDSDRGDYRSAVLAARRAVTIDPGFAMGWVSLGNSFNGLGVRDSIAYAFDQAQRNQDRLLDWQRIRLRFLQAAMVENDPNAALREIDLLIRLNPEKNWHNDRGVILSDLGRTREAITAYSRACSVAVFGFPIALHNLIRKDLFVYGDTDRATQLVEGLPGDRGLQVRLEIALGRGRWTVADSLLLELGNAHQDWSALIEQSLQCVRGKVTSASRGFETVAAASSPEISSYASLCRRLLSATGVVAPTDSLAKRTLGANSEDQAMLALLSAMYGDEKELRSGIAALESQSRKKPRIDLDIRLARAWAAVHDRRWMDVIELLERTPDSPFNPWAGALPLRWALALAHEQLEKRQDAVRLYELVLWPGHLDENDFWIRPTLVPFAHQKLVVLYSQLGDMKNARQHWKVLEETVTSPDAQMAVLLEEARQAMSAASTVP
jgi:tetratricopeptide (TPR) repeat protein